MFEDHEEQLQALIKRAETPVLGLLGTLLPLEAREATRTAHRDHAGHRGAAATERAPLALAAGVAAGLRVRGGAGPVGIGSGGLLAQLCGGGRAVCYQSDSFRGK